MSKLRKRGSRTRADRRKDAEARQEYYNSLTLEQKLSRLPINGESKKEIAKLEYQIKYGRKPGKGNPTNSKKKSDKPSRRERWESKQEKSS